MSQWNRRQMLKMTGMAAASASVAKCFPAPAAKAAESGETTRPKMQVGIFWEVFSCRTPEEQFAAIKAQGLDCVQLGLNAAGMSFMPDAISAEGRRALERLHAISTSQNIPIVAVHGTFNMAHPDPEHRELGLRRLRVVAEACPLLGASMIHICTGTRSRRSMWSIDSGNTTPEAWRDMLACVRQAVKIAEAAHVTLGFEPEVSNIVDSAQKARRLLDEVGSPRLKVTIDGANLFHRGELAHMDEVLDRAFELVGHDIVMAHAKDLDHDGAAGELPAGQGKLDYARYLTLLHRFNFRGPLLLHGLGESDVPGCVKFLKEKLAKVEG